MSEGVIAHEGIIAHEGVIAHDAVGPTVLEYGASPELDWPRPERGPSRAVWARLAFFGLIGSLIGVLLAVQLNLRGIRLVGLTVPITAIWFLALRRTAHLARDRQLQPVLGALIGAVFGLAIVSLLNLWVLDLLISPRELYVMAGCVFLVAAGFQAVASRDLNPRRRVVVVEPDSDSMKLIHELHDERSEEFECIGTVSDRNGFGSNGVPLLGEASDLVEILRQHHPEVVVCSTDSHGRTVDRLLDAGMTSFHVLDALEFQERAFRRVESRSVSPAWFASVLDIHRQNYSARAKRIFDGTVASLALVLTSPLLLVIPALVRCSGRGPVLFRQVRMGEGGELFEMLKFRTMILNAEVGQAVWAAENDPRVTAVGRVLRKTRMDELPQLWNVVRGDMSIVGPRPERPEFLEVLGEHVPFWSRRDLLKPGITGWAQVHFDYTSDISGAATKLSYDLYYLKHRSLALDALILLKTIRVVLFRRGAR